MESMENQERFYEDEPIRLTPERAKNLVPKEYRKMRDLAFGSPFSRNNDAKIFYLQARYMEHFEDDCPYDREVLHYYPTYQSLSTSELRGYFTWRTRLRHGQLEKTSLSYAYLYIYELLNQIGTKTKEEGLKALIWFYEQYGALDSRIRQHVRQWIIDYAVYYDLPVEQIRAYTDTDFDEALIALCNCDAVSDEMLLAAILQLCTYHLEKSKAYKKYPEELTKVICEAYRELNGQHVKRYGRPYLQKLCGGPAKVRYYPFHAAVFYEQKRFEHYERYEYRLSPIQCYCCERNQWSLERVCASPGPSRDLSAFVRAADRLMREDRGIKPALKVGDETKEMERFISGAIAEQKKPAVIRVEFDLSKLSDIRKSSETVGQKLMTEEERYTETGRVETECYEKTECFEGMKQTVMRGESSVTQEERSVIQEGKPFAQEKKTGSEVCVLSGDELRFMQILLYGGDLQGFLAEKHRMASILAETVNEQLYDEFADTVIEFDGNTPVIVEDYRDDLKGMIPN